MGYIREMEIQAPVERVWEMFTTTAEVTRWLAPRANVRFEVGGPFELFWADTSDVSSTTGCRVRSLTPREGFEVDWALTGRFAKVFTEGRGVLRVQVRGDGATTTVCVEEPGARGATYDEEIAEAWEQALVNLKQWVEQGEVASTWPDVG